jgi:hypothetical protein
MSEITRSPLCWPDNVPRTAPQNRHWPLFAEKTIALATTFLLEEINRLNRRRYDYSDDSVIISSNLKLRLDGLPSGNQPEPLDTGVAIYFKLLFSRNARLFERPVVLTCDKWRKVSFNIDAIARDIQAQRARQRYGCTNIEQAFRGYLAIPERCGGPSWWVLLNIPSTATEQQVKDRFKQLAKTSHPDVGGSREQWLQLQEAYDQAMALFRKEAA